MDRVTDKQNLQAQVAATTAPLVINQIHQAAPDELVDANKEKAAKFLRKEYRAGRLRARKSGPHLWARRSDILALVEFGEVPSAAESGTELAGDDDGRDAAVRRIAGRQ